MLADLWNAPHAANAIGTATTGSSEAIQLGGLALKRIWQDKRKAAGKSIHEPGPNIVMGAPHPAPRPLLTRPRRRERPGCAREVRTPRSP